MASEMSADYSGQMREDLEKLRTDLRQVRSDLSLLRDDAVKAARTGATEARGRIDEHLKTVSEKGRHTIESVEGRVHEHPMMALAAAFVVGVVIGVGFGRGR